MPIHPVATDVWQLTGYPPHCLNSYLLGEILIDAGTRWSRHRLLHDLKRRRLSMVALTHCHPDHQGLAKLICESRGIPLACHEAEVAAVEGRAPMQPDNWLVRFGHRFIAGPSHPVSRALRDGDELAGFRVIHAPGHTPGHMMLFRESDRLVIAGDVLANINMLKMREELVEPPPFFSSDRAENRRSAVMLARLEPSIVCFGHGPPLRDARKLAAFVRKWE